MLPTEQPFKTYTDRDGKPLNGGFVYFGQPNLDPISNPITVYWDAAGTIPASQPLRTMGGYIVRNGTPANVFFDTAYSELVNDSRGNRVFYANTSAEFSVATVVSDFITQLASSAGSALVGFIQTGIGAVQTTVQAVLRLFRVTPQQFGAVGDGVTDDTAALQKMWDTGRPWYIPYTSNGYLISSTLTVAADGECDGYLIAVAGFNTLAIDMANPGYGSKRIVRGLEVRVTNARVANSVGIRVAYPSIVLDRCRVAAFDYGIQVWSYSINLQNCVSQLCNTNVSAYAPSSSQEINDLKIIGGNYDSAIEYAMRIGDPRFASSVAPGNPHGVSIIVEGANFDGAKVTIDRVFACQFNGTYHEGNDSGIAIEIGGTGNNNCRDIVIGPGCYFARFDYAVYCNNVVKGLVVEPNYYAVSYCALYAVNCDVGGFVYRKGYSNGFDGPEVHTGFTYTTTSALTFGDITIEQDFLYDGVQIAPSQTATDNWYPYGRTRDGWVQYNGAYGRFRKTAYSGIAGTQSGTNFTCTTPSDALKFNGGDIVTGANGATFVRYVDYVNGIVVVDSVGSGATTLSHDGAAAFIGQNVRGFGSPEGVLAAPIGSTYVDMGTNIAGNFYVKQSGTGNTGWAAK